MTEERPDIVISEIAGSEVRREANFVSKLYDMIINYPQVIGFGPGGDVVIVHDPKVLLLLLVFFLFFSLKTNRLIRN